MKLLFSLLLISPFCVASPLVQNPDARAGASLDGSWARIIDPYENGYYNHRYEPHRDGYFANRQPQDPSELIEYDFASTPRLMAPGDWNSQEPELFFYEGTVWDFGARNRRCSTTFPGALTVKSSRTGSASGASRLTAPTFC